MPPASGTAPKSATRVQKNGAVTPGSLFHCHRTAGYCVGPCQGPGRLRQVPPGGHGKPFNKGLTVDDAVPMEEQLCASHLPPPPWCSPHSPSRPRRMQPAKPTTATGRAPAITHFPVMTAWRLRGPQGRGRYRLHPPEGWIGARLTARTRPTRHRWAPVTHSSMGTVLTEARPKAPDGGGKYTLPDLLPRPFRGAAVTIPDPTGEVKRYRHAECHPRPVPHRGLARLRQP